MKQMKGGKEKRKQETEGQGDRQAGRKIVTTRGEGAVRGRNIPHTSKK